MAHHHHHGCSCGCQHPQSTTPVAVNGTVIQIRGLIELLMPIAEAATPLEGLDYGAIISELRCINPDADISDDTLQTAIMEEYASMLPDEDK